MLLADGAGGRSSSAAYFTLKGIAVSAARFLKGLRPNPARRQRRFGRHDYDGRQPRTMKAQSYLYRFEMLQVGLHTTTAYDILRQVNVKIGKRDYLDSMPS